MIAGTQGAQTLNHHFTSMHRTLKYFLITGSILISPAFITGDDFVEQLQANLDFHYKSNVPVKLHLFHNQPGYAPGDTVYFKATMVTEADHQLLGERAVVEVRLKDTAGKLCSEQKTLLKNGLGAGYLIIPDSLKGGIYILEAFNSWMKNHPASFYFHKPLAISAKNKFSTTSTVGFYPEGGKLIEGVTNKVVIRGAPFSTGSILTSEGKKVTDFVLRESGLASLYLIPRQETYLYTINGSAQIPLPVKVEEGINLLATGMEEAKQIKLVVQNSASNKLKETVHVIIWHHNRIVYEAELSFKRKDGHIIQIPKENMPEGVSGITLFTSSGQVLAERLFYIPAPANDAIQILLSNENYQVRESVEVELALNQDLVNANVAVSVFEDDLFTSEPTQNNIRSYFNLCSEVPEGCHVKLTNPKDIDLFMITQPWKRFDWKNIMKRTILNSFHIDTKLSVSGKAYFADTGEPVPDSTKLLFLMKKDLMNYETTTLDNGQFHFPLLLDFAGTCQVFYQAFLNDTKLKNVKIELYENESSETIRKPVEENMRDTYHQFCRDKKEVTDAFMSTQDITVPQPDNWTTQILTSVKGEDQSINLRDYLMFPTLKETIHEVIPNLKARSGKNDDFVRMTIFDQDQEVKDQYRGTKEDPIYIIDGVLTENTPYFLSIRPEDIVSVKIINAQKKLSQLGLEQNGIVLIETSIPDNPKKVPNSESIFTINGFNEKSKFSMVQSPMQTPRIPDIRSCLFWHPQVKISGEKRVSFSFQTPDNTGTYKIVVDGITSSGKPVHQEKIFKVVFGE